MRGKATSRLLSVAIGLSAWALGIAAENDTNAEGGAVAMRPQNVIVFSSGKNLAVAEALADGLRADDCRPVVWKDYFQAVFGSEYGRTKSYALFPFLSKKIPSFDFAVVVAGDDDATRKDSPATDWNGFDPSSGGEHDFITTRDNVVFELGMCCMALGETRVVLVRHKDVRLLDDLRGRNADQRKVEGPSGLKSTLLTTDNIQLTAFEYSDPADLPGIAAKIRDYVRASHDVFAPVVIGAACATASGYIGNFVSSLCHGLADARASDSPEGFLSYGGQPCTAEEARQHMDPATAEILVLLPDSSCPAPEEFLRDPKGFLFGNWYPSQGVRTDGRLEDRRRPIEFCADVSDSGVRYVDVPTTILASYETARRILEIDADEERVEVGQKTRFLAKEMDNFEAALRKLLVPHPSGEGYAIPGGGPASEYRIRVEKADFRDSGRHAALHPLQNP